MAHTLHVSTAVPRLNEALCLGLNRPYSPASFPNIASGELVDLELHLVSGRGSLDPRSGSADYAPSIIIAVPGSELLIESTLTGTGEGFWALQLDATAPVFVQATDEGDLVAAYTIQISKPDGQTVDVLARGPVFCRRPAVADDGNPVPANAIRYDVGYVRFDTGYLLYA